MEEEEEEAAALDRYSAAGRNPCPSVLLNPRRRRQSCHAGERSSQKRGARRGAGQPRERRLPGPRQAGPDPLQQHFRGQRYRPLARRPAGSGPRLTVTLALGALRSFKVARSSGSPLQSTPERERGGLWTRPIVGLGDP